MKLRTYFLPLSLCLGLLACQPGPQSNPPPEQAARYGIAFNVLVHADSDDYEVFVMDQDGSNPHNLTNHPDVAWTYLADGPTIYFISDRDSGYRCYYLYAMDARGNEVRKVSDLRLEDSWMDVRDTDAGKELVVSGRVGNTIRHQLFLVDVVSGQYTQLTEDTAAMHRDPVFSPDGQHIVCAYKAHKRDKNSHEELYRMPVSGGAMVQLTHYPDDDPDRSGYGYKAGPPRWHPTEDFISYQSRQAGKYSLFAVSPDGRKQWKLTDNAMSEGWHDWSPDGRWLAVEVSESANKWFRIGLMDWTNKSFRILTDTSYQYQQAPVFVRME